jgi:hypothetical protein
MWKYRKVRELVQAQVGVGGGLSDEEDARSRVYCGKLTTNSFSLNRCVIFALNVLFECTQDFRVSPLATREELLTTHDAQYVHRYLNGEMTESENRNIGFPWRYYTI